MTTSEVGLRALIGKRCAIIFDLPFNDWPIPGSPAWAYVEDVDGCMVLLDKVWVNTRIIRTISE